MPRRSILTAAEYDSLVAIPDARDELIRLYTFSDADLVLVSQRRGPANRLGFAVQPRYLRFSGAVLGADAAPFVPLLRMVAAQIKVPPDAWGRYSERAETRREHLLELQAHLGLQSFTTAQHYRLAVHGLDELAWQIDRASCWPPRWSPACGGKACCCPPPT